MRTYSSKHSHLLAKLLLTTALIAGFAGAVQAETLQEALAALYNEFVTP